MLQHPEIVEIWERTEQGMTKPYRCGADDGNSYYVKSVGAGWRSLVCEWVAGRLASAFGLPIPPIEQVKVHEGLASAVRLGGDRDLCEGLAFGSKIAPNVREFEPALLAQCAPAFRRDLVAFDWWVHNADRTLGVLSGNPNLLWDTQTALPIVIDHNLAFDLQFNAPLFLETHVFRQDFVDLTADLIMRAEYEQRFSTLVPLLNEIWLELPQNWIETEEQSLRFVKSDFFLLLDRVHQPHFWVAT